MFKRFLTACFLMSMIAQAGAQSAFVQGVDYDVLPQAVRTSQPDKVVVTEMFWYGCPHCFRFEPHVEHWSADLPEDVVFEQVPSVLNPRWSEHARTYYSLKLMGALDQAHRAFFDAIHLKRQRLTDLDSISGFVADQGLDVDEFRKHFRSFEVDTQIRKNGKREARYGHRGVPAVIVNGKYLVSAGKAGSNERMIQIMQFLVDQERAQSS